MGCPPADALSDLAAGKLPAERASDLHRHVRTCEACAAAFAAMGAAADAGPEDSLRPGERIGRFELLEPLGAGSMGAVWSARDTDLGRIVALKTLRPLEDGASDAAGLKRLLREAQAMARLSHPNVVTVHEVVARGEQIFLAMERVGGGTLREWLLQPRRLDELLAVFAEAGKGLAAAHAAGLVHRDFKPDNVLVGHDGRVRVTDFGLARPTGTARPAASSPDPPPSLDLTRSGALVGTPAYMAPEQMRGEPIDARADVFGFCISLYEAVYGARPFAGSNLDELRHNAEANRIAPPPSSRRAPAWLRRLLLKGLRAAPDERWASMDELLKAIARGRAQSGRRPFFLAAGAAVAVAAAVVWLVPRAPPPRAQQPAGPRRSVAVLGPRNDSGRADSAWLSAALADMMVSELAASEDLRLVPESNVARAADDLGLSRAQDPGAAELTRLRALLGADLVLAGSYAAGAAGPLRLDLRLYDARDGELLAGASESGMLFELAAKAGAKLRQVLHAAPPSAPGAASASYPSDPEAERLYVEGLAALRRYEPGAAVKALARAAELAPNNARILASLAEAHALAGDIASAREAGRRAFAASSGLDRQERLRIERVMESPAGSDWRRAVEISQALWTFFPDDIEYGLKLENDLTSARRIDDAYQVVAQLRKLPEPAASDPRIDAAEAQTALQARDHQRALAAARRAIDGGRRTGARHAVAQGRLIEGTTLFDLAEPGPAATALAEAEKLFGDTGDRQGLAHTLRIQGWVIEEAGDLSAARAKFEQGLSIAHDIGDRYIDAALENDLGNVLSRLRLAQPALQHYDVARAGFQKLNRTLAAVMVTYNRGDILADEGDLAAAGREYQTALTADRAMDGTPYLSHIVDLLAWVAWQRNDLQQAAKLCGEANQTAGTEVFQIGDGHLCSARVELAQGHADAAAGHAAKAAELFGGVRHVDGLARAQALRAHALLALGKVAEAADAAAAARKALEGNQSVRARAAAGIASARVRAAQGQLAAAIAALREVSAQADQNGSASDRFEIRLALAELLVRARDPAGKTAISTLVREASARGFERIAAAARAIR